MSCEFTNLWQHSLGLDPEDPNDRKAVEKLRSTFSTFRERVGVLVGKVQADFPELTIHDITHLDALWETADVICGYDYPLNPLEGFLLGGAILLHDAALTFEAYKGRDCLRSTQIWKDMYALNKKRSMADQLAEADADFTAVRYLHAKQAKELATRSWRTQEGADLYLIENAELRKHYGAVIGEIAASHHASVDQLQTLLPQQLNSPASMPRAWRVDPIKIACILRCADAAHIDERRAPDFLRSIIKAKGLSAHHWKAQNWLQRADIDTSDQNADALLITSSRPFEKEDADAWWVAFDAITLIDKELRKSHDLLNRRAQREHAPPFAMRRVSGADDPIVASKHIAVHGWFPQQVEVHISDVEKLVENLGGQQLYADNQVIVVLRELTQNARDAISARRLLETNFRGEITIKISQIDGRWWLEVVDNGVGMSQNVLTNELLDFGTSFWNSNKIASEFPGLASKGMQSAGKFGIGFYSIFMTCDRVEIVSRRWDAARDSSLMLEFPTGLSMRPLLTEVGSGNLHPQDSTSVRARIKESVKEPNKVVVRHGYDGLPNVFDTIDNVLGRTVGGLDVDVYCEFDGNRRLIHRNIQTISTREQKVEWLASLATASGAKREISELTEGADRLRSVGSPQDNYGLAAISIRGYAGNFGLNTINGLSGEYGNRGRFEGSIDHFPSSASRARSDKRRAPDDVFADWLAEQLTIIDNGALTPIDCFMICCSVAELNAEIPENFISVPIFVEGHTGVVFKNADDLFQMLTGDGVCVYFDSMDSTHMATWGPQMPFNGIPAVDCSRFSRYLSIDRSCDGPSWTLYGVLRQIAQVRGSKLSIETRKHAAQGKVGKVHVDILSCRAP